MYVKNSQDATKCVPYSWKHNVKTNVQVKKIASILPWVCICKDVKKMKQRWSTRCQKCIKRQLLCPARCALRKTKQQEACRSSCVHYHLWQSIPPHRATWGCTRGRASGDLRPWGLVKGRGSAISICQLWIRKWQRSAWPVGEGRSGRGSCGQWCKALARAGQSSWVRRLHALRLPWQPVSKRQLSEAPKLQWFQRPEGWTEQRHISAVCKCGIFVPAYAEAAAKACRAAAPRASCRKGAVKAKSNAIGEPRYDGTNRSAGRRPAERYSSGRWRRSRPAFSFSGCSPALSAQW